MNSFRPLPTEAAAPTGLAAKAAAGLEVLVAAVVFCFLGGRGSLVTRPIKAAGSRAMALPRLPGKKKKTSFFYIFKTEKIYLAAANNESNNANKQFK